jgi:hypothetical protein
MSCGITTPNRSELLAAFGALSAISATVEALRLTLTMAIEEGEPADDFPLAIWAEAAACGALDDSPTRAERLADELDARDYAETMRGAA